MYSGTKYVLERMVESANGFSTMYCAILEQYSKRMTSGAHCDPQYGVSAGKTMNFLLKTMKFELNLICIFMKDGI